MNNKKIAVFSTYLDNYGAFNASYNIHKLFQGINGVDSTYITRKNYLADNTVIEYKNNIFRQLLIKFEQLFHKFNSSSSTNSSNLTRSNLSKVLNNYDLVNFHWIGDGGITVKDIAKIKKPIIMHLHDEWLFSGSKHYTDDIKNTTLDEYLIAKKIKYLKNKEIIAITPSTWIAKKLEDSEISKNWTIKQIFNPVNEIFFDNPKTNFHKKFNISEDKILVSTGAQNFDKSDYKGFSRISESLNSSLLRKYKFVIFGLNKTDYDFGENVIQIGKIDQLEVRDLLCASDIFLIPSIYENSPQVVVEAMACRNIVLYSDTGGIREIVGSDKFGSIVSSFKPSELKELIDLHTKNIAELTKNKNSARNHINENFSNSAIRNKYKKLFNSIAF